MSWSYNAKGATPTEALANFIAKGAEAPHVDNVPADGRVNRAAEMLVQQIPADRETQISTSGHVGDVKEHGSATVYVEWSAEPVPEVPEEE